MILTDYPAAVIQEDHPLEELRQLNAVLQEAVEGISRLNAEGRYISVNPAYAQMAGFLPEEMIGKSWEITVHPEDAERIKALFERMRWEGKAGGEVKGLRKDGTPFYKEVFIVAVLDKDLNYAGLYCLTKDITERKQTEQRLTVMTQGLRAVIAAADELITCPDLDTVYRRAVELAREKFQVERCSIYLDENDSVSGTYGTDCQGRTTREHSHVFPKSARWRKWLRLQPPQSPQWVVSEETHYEWTGEEMAPIGRGWIALTPILPSEADTRPIGVFVNDQAISGGPLEQAQQEILAVFCSLLGNVIQRKRAEEDHSRSLVREREKSEQLKLAIREAHHRIKNNLQAVSDLIYLELSIKKVSHPRKVLQASMERIQAIALVHDLLSLDEDVRWVDMKGVVDRLIPMVLSGYGLSSDSMRLKVSIPTIHLDSKRATSLALILNELVSNAAKHAFSERSKPELEVCLELNEKDIELHVRDNGPGLPPGFNTNRDGHMGLEVALMLAQNDLKGCLELISYPAGLTAIVRFPHDYMKHNH